MNLLVIINYPKCVNSGTGEIKEREACNIILVDTTKNQVVNSYLSTEDTLYTYGFNNMYFNKENEKLEGVLLEKRVKTKDGYIVYFIDLESNQVKFSIDLSQLGSRDCFWYHDWGYSKKHLPIFNYKKRKNGKRKKEYIGYYDFETKIYKKGRCRACEM